MRKACLAGAVVLALAGSALAQRTYEGREAAALRCANLLSITAVFLFEAEQISPLERDVMLFATVAILERHVSGTRAEKQRALAVVRERRDVPETLDDYQRNARRCLKQFPIN
ncbi:hypothetical protein [Sulfitobacter sp. JB4-11]|uniref:hypothetical protein n=1 Tax=Sulfitobacter rhodophyticola TaxID=3238304 RepID=UPI003516D009